MYYRLLVLCISLLLVGSNVLASGLRVNTIGFPGLIADEEVDIALNPACLGLLTSPRIYAGGNFLYRKISNEYYSHKINNRLGYLESIFPVGNTWIAIKYQPSIYEEDSSREVFWGWEDDRSRETASYKDNKNNLLAGIGLAISNKLSLGMNIAVNYWQSNINESIWNNIEERGKTIQTDLGCWYGVPKDSNIGIVISGISYTNRKELEASILPSWSLNAKNSLKGFIKANGHNLKNLIGFTSLAWNCQYTSTGMFDLALIHYGIYYNNYENYYCTVGIEQKIISKLKARGGATIALSREYSTLSDTVAFGFGYELINNLTIDLAYKIHLPDYNREIGIAGSYYFSR